MERKCKISGCQEPAVHGYNPPRCAAHKAQRQERQRKTAAQPDCAFQPCGNKAAMHSKYCNAHMDSENRVTRHSAHMELLECHSVESLKDFLERHLLPFID